MRIRRDKFPDEKAVSLLRAKPFSGFKAESLTGNHFDVQNGEFFQIRSEFAEKAWTIQEREFEIQEKPLFPVNYRLTAGIPRVGNEHGFLRIFRQRHTGKV